MTLNPRCHAILKKATTQLLTVTLLLSAPATATNAETQITFSSLIDQFESEKHHTYGYFAQELVGSLNSVAAGATRWGHERLGLSDSSPMHRWIYLATAVHLQARLQWANSMYFGHEFSHFSTAHQFGRVNHYFRDAGSGERQSYGDAYLRTILKGHPGGPAVSHGNLSPEQRRKHEAERITSTTAGLNWQMNYSERWLRQHLTYGPKDVFDAPDFFMNRAYLAAYAYGDKQRAKKPRAVGDQGIRGDVEKWAKRMTAQHGEKDALEDAFVYGIGATFASPAFWSVNSAIGAYASSGETALPDVFLTTPIGGLTWDVPQYLNLDSMTLAPTIYWQPDEQLTGFLGADTIVLGYAREFAVVGQTEDEHRFTLTGQWDRFQADLGVTQSKSGSLTEFEMSFDLNDSIAVTGGAAIADGDTLRGRRNFPFGNHETWVGLRITF